MALTLASGLPAPASAHGGHAHSASPVRAAASSAATQRVTVTGELRRIHGHRGRSRAPVAGWLLTTRRGARIPLEFARGVAAPAGVDVRVSGIRRGAVLRVTRFRRVAGGASARASALPVGAKKTAVILFNFSDQRSRPFSEDDVRSALFTGTRSVSAFYAAESRGKLSLTGLQRPDGDIHGWYEIDASGSECFGGADWDWYEKADAAARADGVDLSGYDHVVYVHPRVASCQFAGIASLGGSWSSLNGTIGLWVAGHEIGHNYEFEHAGRAYCKDEQGRPVAISDACTVGEYDDPYDIMGNRFQRHSSGIRQLQARWIPASNARTVTTTSTHDLAPLAETTDAAQVLRVPRGDGRSYWLEFRRPQGVFDDFAATESVISGVTIRLAGPPSDPGVSELIDTNPATHRSARDEALGIGRTFVDARHRITITTEAAGPEGARVTVGVGVDAPAAVSAGDAPSPATAPPAPSAPATTDTPAPTPPAPAPAAPAVRRVSVESAVSGARRLRAHRLTAIDGRFLTVGSRRARATLDLRYRPGADARRRTSRLDLRLRAPRACLADVSVRANGRSFARVARIAARKSWADATLALPRGALGAATDVRIACAGGPRQLTLDAARLTLR